MHYIIPQFPYPDKTHPRDPTTISKAYTDDSIWRNRDRFLTGTEAIVQFLTAKWEKEKSYRCEILSIVPPIDPDADIALMQSAQGAVRFQGQQDRCPVLV